MKRMSLALLLVLCCLSVANAGEQDAIDAEADAAHKRSVAQRIREGALDAWDAWYPGKEGTAEYNMVFYLLESGASKEGESDSYYTFGHAAFVIDLWPEAIRLYDLSGDRANDAFYAFYEALSVMEFGIETPPIPSEGP